MTAPTLPTTDSLTEVMVDAAMGWSECFIEADDHAGDKVAYILIHEPCKSGYVCKAHWDHFVQNQLPGYHKTFEQQGFIRCALCKTICRSVDEFCKGYPL